MLGSMEYDWTISRTMGKTLKRATITLMQARNATNPSIAENSSLFVRAWYILHLS